MSDIEEKPQKVYKTPDYMRRSTQKYYQKNREKILEQQKQYKHNRFENDEEFRARKKEYDRNYHARVKEEKIKKEKSMSSKIDLIANFINQAMQSIEKQEPLTTKSFELLD